MIKSSKLLRIFSGILIVSLAIGVFANLFFPLNGLLTCIILVASAVLWWLVPIITARLDCLTSRQTQFLVGSILVLMFLAQLFILKFFPATVYHDPFRVYNQAERLSRGIQVWNNTNYFYMYPNNVVLAALMGWWIKFCTIFGFSTNLAIHILAISFLDAFIATVVTLTHKISQRSTPSILTALFFLVTPFAYTYYLQVFYSDMPSLLALALMLVALYHWQSAGRLQRVGYGILLFCAVLLGQLLKPNIIVMAAAIVIVAGYLFVCNRQLLVKMVLPFLIVGTGFAASVPVKAVINSAVGYTTNARYTMPVSSWMMMGMNNKTNGTYSTKDVTILENVASSSARNTKAKQILVQRIKKMGPIGLVNHLMSKMSVMLNESHVQASYTGGFISAPSWYQNHIEVVSVLFSLISRIGWIGIFLLTIRKLWIFNRSQSDVSVTWVIAMLGTLGYLAFHTLLWETESRYGQIILPLLLFITAAPMTATIAIKRIRVQAWVQMAVLGAVLSAAFVYISISDVDPISKSTIVAAQRSQMSIKYGASPAYVKPGQELTQEVDLKGPTTKLRLQKIAGAQLMGELINETTGQGYQLQDGNDYTVTADLQPGKYRMELINNTTKDQPVSIAKMINYRLAAYPLTINGRAYQYQSLIYQFVGQNVVYYSTDIRMF